MIKNCLFLLVLAGLIFVSSPLWIVAQDKPVSPKRAPVADVTTEGTVNVNGQTITYRTTAGILTVGSDEMLDATLSTDESYLPGNDQGTARMFYVAYFKKETGANRPITFIYNGGPGGASLPLHLGAFGPRRVLLPDAKPDGGTRYELVNNDSSLLDASDLVFIDAPGTGFGQISGAVKLFWGDDADTHAFSRFIRRFLTRYDRWNSPKYLLGESYGTLRNAMVAADLTDVHFNGIVMLSQILSFDDFNGGVYHPGTDQSYALALPSFAATAYYYHRLPVQPRDLRSFLVEVEHFALSDYMIALLQGSELSENQKKAIAEKLHGYTGLSAALWLKADLRMPSPVFEGSLLGDSATTVGQLDARFSGPSPSPLDSSAPNYDPLLNDISPALTAAFYQYAREELHWPGDQTYHMLLGDVNNFSWDWQHKISSDIAMQGPGAATNVMPDLAYAMKLNPTMKVLLTGGYYDIATPYFEAEYEMHHLPIPEELQKNISFRLYQSGHMIYVHREALKQLHSDLAEFIRSTEAGN